MTFRHLASALAVTALLAVAPSSEATAAPVLLGPIMMTPTVVAPSVAQTRSLFDLPVVADMIEIAQGVGDLLPDFVTQGTTGWNERVETFFTGFAEHVTAFAAFQPPNLMCLTAEPIASGNFYEESSGYGWRNDPIGHFPKFHSGTDFRGKRGTPVLAAGSGTVIFAGSKNGYGNIVIVDHGDGITTRYAHLKKIISRKDSVVTAGMQVGELGATGRATGPHLHFEVRLEGRPVDPVSALQIATLQRESPALGNLAAHALSPEMQKQAASRIDPPKRGKHAKKKESRPDRAGRVRTPKPLS